jgi:cyclopropane-fatty-acyl-phospholipid synthase
MQIDNTLISANNVIVSQQKTIKSNLWKTLVHKQFSKLENCHLIITDPLGVSEYGSDKYETVKINVNNMAFYRRIIFEGTMGVAESYMENYWDCDQLYELFKIFSSARSSIEKMDGAFTKWTRPFLLLNEWRLKNSKTKSRDNISAHYDLGNSLFKNFLDPTMNYSSGIFENKNDSLEKASIAKVDRLCSVLELNESDHLLEIGTGWGSLAMHAAKNYGCKVTTTTLSEEQKKYAEEKIKDLGLDNQITVLLKDYRLLEGEYSKIVSVEMIEAVGPQYFGVYFKKCRSLLKRGGLAAIQAITVPDHTYEDHLKNVDFIQKYIFPGSKIPSISILLQEASKNGNFVLSDLKDIGQDYAQTMRIWHSNFMENIEEVKSLGYDDRFIRMWNYYLNYCAAGFSTRYLGTVQMLLRNND